VPGDEDPEGRCKRQCEHPSPINRVGGSTGQRYRPMSDGEQIREEEEEKKRTMQHKGIREEER